MFFYSICGCTFRSNAPMPELPLGDERHSEFTFQLCADIQDFSEPRHWLNHWRSRDGSVWLAFAKLEAGYLLRFPALADFVVAPDAHTIYGYPRADSPPETIRHLLLNQVIPIVLSHLGKLVLHASACATPHGAIAFLGMTGMGKSTLAASFGLRGFAVLTDDCLLIEERDAGFVTISSYAGLRLWPESVTALFKDAPVLQPLAHYTEKKRLLFEQVHCDSPFPLSAVYLLSQPEKKPGVADVSITPLAASEALLEIVKHTFQLDITDQARLRRAFRQYEGLAKSAPFFKLAYPREHVLLTAVNNAILNHVDFIQN